MSDARCETVLLIMHSASDQQMWHCALMQEATKQQIAISPQRHFRGYQGLGTNVTRYDGGFARDHHEGIDFYKDVMVRPSPSYAFPFSSILSWEDAHTYDIFRHT